MANWIDALIPRGSRSTTTEAQRWQRWLMGDSSPNPSGMVVNERTAMGIAAYFACRRNISEDVAKQPVRLSKVRVGGGNEAVSKHELLPVLNRRPNPQMTAMSFWECIMSHALTHESAYAEIVRDRGGTGTALQLWPIDPARVTIYDQDSTGPLVYGVRMERGSRELLIDARDMFHVHGVGDNGITAWVASQVGRVTLGKIMASTSHSAAFFGNNAILSGILEVPPLLKKEAIQNLRDTFRIRHEGADNAYRTAVLTDGVKYTTISSDPEKSQLVQAIYQGVEEVCRYFRCPPNKIQHLLRSTYSNISEENRAYATDTLQPWTERLAQEIQVKLLGRDEQDIEVYFDDSMFLEADPVKRTEVRMKQFQMGMHSIDDLLIEAGKEPIGGEVGEARFVMSNVVPIKKALIMPAPATPATPAPSAPEPDGSDEDDALNPANESSLTVPAIDAAFRIVFAGHFERMIKASEVKAKEAQRRGKLPEFQADYRKNAMVFVADGVKESVCAYMVAHGVSANGQIDAMLNRIAAEYISVSGQRMLDVCSGVDRDAAANVQSIVSFALKACREGLTNEN